MVATIISRPCLLLHSEVTVCGGLGFAGACQYWGAGSQRLFTLEFDRLRKSMGVIVKELGNEAGNKLLVKVLLIGADLQLL